MLSLYLNNLVQCHSCFICIRISSGDKIKINIFLPSTCIKRFKVIAYHSYYNQAWLGGNLRTSVMKNMQVRKAPCSCLQGTDDQFSFIAENTSLDGWDYLMVRKYWKILCHFCWDMSLHHGNMKITESVIYLQSIVANGIWLFYTEHSRIERLT